MKQSKRNLAKALAEKVKRQAGAPTVSKYAAKQRPVKGGG